MTSPLIGVCSWSLRPANPGPLVASLNRLDLRCVQLALGPVVGAAVCWAGAVEELAAGGVTVISGMMAMAGEDYSTLESIRRTGGLRPDDTWPANRRLASEAAAAAADMGIGLVTFHAGFLAERPDESSRVAMLRRLDAVAGIFADRGIDLAFETGQERAGTLLGVLDELDRPDVGVNFDPANMILYGMGDPVDGLRQLAGWVRQIHVKDAVAAETPGAWGREVPVGLGAVAWDDFFEVARSIHRPVAYVIEREAGGGRDRDIATAKRLIERHL